MTKMADEMQSTDTKCNDSEPMNEECCSAQKSEENKTVEEDPKKGIGDVTDVKESNNEICPTQDNVDASNADTEMKTECTENMEDTCGSEQDTTTSSTPELSPDDVISFRVVWNKKNYEVKFNSKDTIENLKKHIESLTGLPVSTQKLMFKGLVKDDKKTLQDLNISNNSKMMVVGSTVKDIMTVTLPPTAGALKEDTTVTVSSKEPWCKQKIHKKILDKGKPEDILPGNRLKKEPLPRTPITGMYNKAAGKVRLTFKLEVDQVWIGTKERTEKVSMGSIKNVVSEPIEENEDYHIMALQLGPTEASRYWLYWVPAQYVDGIKDTILGKWQPF